MIQAQTILALAPHTDDAELGCGGALARFLEEGRSVHVVAFSACEDSVPEGEPRDTLRKEGAAALAALGVPHEHVQILAYPVRRLAEHRQAVLDDLIGLRRALRPDLVLLPARGDVHQDHQVVHAEGLRAFKGASVWGYELPWNQISFDAQAGVALEDAHVEAKWRALQAYASQFTLARPYFTRDFIEGLSRVRGTQFGVARAEAFEVYRLKV